MKKATNKRVFATLVPMICLFACLFLYTASVQAQTMTGGNTEQQYNWLDPTEAVAVLKTDIMQVHQQLPGFTEGTPLYENALRRVVYYKAIVREIEQGNSVMVAMERGLTDAATLGGTKEVAYTSKVVLHALYEEIRLQLTE